MDKVRQPPRPEDPETLVPREPLAADDPRASRYRAAYEQRMELLGSVEVQNEEQAAAARDAYARAEAANDAATAKLAEAQDEVNAARAELARQANLIARLGVRGARPLSPAETLSPGEETVLMVFPNPVTLQANALRADGAIVGSRSATFPEGIQEVPVSLQNHPYLIAHDVRPYGGTAIAPKAPKTVKEAEAA